MLQQDLHSTDHRIIYLHGQLNWWALVRLSPIACPTPAFDFSASLLG